MINVSWRHVLRGASSFATAQAQRCGHWLPTGSVRHTSLSVGELAAYRRDGYIKTPYRLPDQELQSARAAMDALLEANPNVPPELLVNSHLVDGEGEAEGVRGRSEFLSLVTSKPVVDMVAQCLGTHNLILWACQIFCKPAYSGKSVPFHQDGQYWPIEPLKAATAWIALDRSHAGNGALQVLPGTHRGQGAFEHVQRIDDEACISYIADPGQLHSMLSTAQTIELEPGEVSIHDSMLLHGSEPNRSDHRRAGVAAVYMPAECWFRRDIQTEGARKGGIKLDYSTRPLFVVKGSNQHPNNFGRHLHSLV